MVSTPSAKEPLVVSESVAELPDRVIVALALSPVTSFVSLSANCCVLSVVEVCSAEVCAEVSVPDDVSAEEVLSALCCDAAEEVCEVPEVVLLLVVLLLSEQAVIAPTVSNSDRKRTTLFFIRIHSFTIGSAVRYKAERKFQGCRFWYAVHQ